jgi:hypothetical protein
MYSLPDGILFKKTYDTAWDMEREWLDRCEEGVQTNINEDKLMHTRRAEVGIPAVLMA